jgi:hypothetical protein
MIWGAGMATTDFLVSKAYHRLRSMGKAMVGHIYLQWISAVAYQPFIRGSQPAAIRLVANSKLTNGDTKTLLLTLNLDKSEDPKAIAEHVYQRTCQWWLRKPAGVTDEMLLRFRQCADAKLGVPEPGKMSSLQLPFFRFTNNARGLS